jgi:1,4-dihydroxy-2-naphthoate octaprenyltransferase
MKWLKLWMKALRVRFFTASLIPILLGIMVAGQSNPLPILRVLLVIGGIFFYHGGSNLINDLYDDLSGTDRINHYYSPFNGGSRVLQEGLITRDICIKAVVFCFTVGTVCALLLASSGGGWEIILLGIAGLFCAYFYSAPPLRLAGTALGEAMVGFAFGPLLVVGTVRALTGYFIKEAFFLSLPIGFLITAVIFINEFPDYQADQVTGKKNLVVRMGKERSIRCFALLLMSAYLLMLLNLILLELPQYLIIFVLTLPLAWWVYWMGKRNLNDARKVLPACAGTIILHFVNGLTLILACFSKWKQ